MNILDLRRSLLPLRGVLNEDGDGGAGGSMGASDQSSGPGGTSASGSYGGGSDGYDGGYNNSSYGGDLGSFNYGNSYGGYSTSSSPSKGQMSSLDITMSLINMGVPGALAVGLAKVSTFNGKQTGFQTAADVAGLLTGLPLGFANRVADKFGLSIGEDGTASPSSTSSNEFGFSGGGGGSDAGLGTHDEMTANGAKTAAEANPLDDLFAHFGAGGTSTAQEFQMPEFDADPSGMIAGGMQSMTDYQRDYAPYAQKMRTEVDRLGSDGYLQQQRGMAMADVQSQYDNTMQQNQRGMQRMGVNPSSGRMLAMQNQGAIQNAASKVGAAAKAEGMVKSNYLAGLGAVNTMGTDLAKMGQGWATIGNDATKTGMAWGLGSAELGLKARTTEQDNTLNWGKLSVDRYGIDKGVQRTQMTNDAQASQNTSNQVWGLAGLGLQSWLS